MIDWERIHDERDEINLSNRREFLLTKEDSIIDLDKVYFSVDNILIVFHGAINQITEEQDYFMSVLLNQPAYCMAATEQNPSAILLDLYDVMRNGKVVNYCYTLQIECQHRITESWKIRTLLGDQLFNVKRELETVDFLDPPVFEFGENRIALNVENLRQHIESINS